MKARRGVKVSLFAKCACILFCGLVRAPSSPICMKAYKKSHFIFGI